MTLTAVILTFNEARHIERAMASVAGIADHILVVDSFSTDRTRELAEAAGAIVLQNPWKNHATQFNWALDHLPAGNDWVLRLDADEVVTEALAGEIKAGLAGLGDEIDGVFVPRRMTFLGKTIRWGGVFPVQVLRLFRAGRGRCENRWMDEHIKVPGQTTQFTGELIDDNLNSLTWWTTKHNSYASREVVDLLNLKHGFMPHETVADLAGWQQAGVKRWFKEHVYARLPGGARAFSYFLYRFVVRLGFLDGTRGAAFHVLQGFWYRYLVDMKLMEVTRYMDEHETTAPEAIHEVLGIDLRGAGGAAEHGLG
ncbi:MAG: glycosyltransferase family 2 protein [Pseudomonadota bacterium]|nr:glycosyltransferase family 2 protein [Pseudomonadota bacterium]